MNGTKLLRRPPRFRRGDLVEVRSEGEIRATLDAEGKLEGLPFMKEMLPYCGRPYRVFRRAEKVFFDHHYYVARLRDTVLLEDLRCDGSAHGACQMGCLLLWKAAWLKPAKAVQDGPPRKRPAAPARVGRPKDRFSCQATELVRATSRLPGWDVGQYLRDLVSGDVTLGQFVRMCKHLAANRLKRLLPSGANGHQAVRPRPPHPAALDLQPGEWVQVRSPEEIAATLDSHNRTRGLSFGPDMAKLCGKRLRVAKRVERIVIEWTGQMREISGTVALEGSTCDGLAQRACPRNCYHLWRECWLQRADPPEEAAAELPVAGR
jgi:hypothetical protein